MNQSSLKHWIIPVFLFSTLISCNALVSRVMPERGAFTGPTGEGTVGQVYWSGQKCQAILDWLDRFKKEYPHEKIAYYPTSFRPESPKPIANLLRDSEFIPVFGFPYDQEHYREIKTINSEVIKGCHGWGANRTMYYREQFNPIKSFFDNVFGRAQPQLVALARDYTEREKWMTTALKDLEDMPETETAYDRLTKNIIPTGLEKTAPLWPREKNAFQTAVRSKQKEMAKHILANNYADLDQQPDTMATLNRLTKAMVYAEILEGERDPLAKRLRARKDSLIRIILADHRDRLTQIPFTLEGRDQSLHWVRAFEAEFAKMNEPEVLALSRAWANKRDRIYHMTKDDFMKKLEALPTGPRAAKAHHQLMAETFPMQRDFNMTSYQDYWKESLHRQKPVVERVLGTTTDSLAEGLEAIRKGLKEAAKEMVR